MRSLTIAAVAVAALTGAMPADAQQAIQGARAMRPAMPGAQMPHPGMPNTGRPGGWSGGANGGGQWHGGSNGGGQWHGGGNWNGGSHWGGSTGGRWQGGWNAPGGWNAYRRPTRGWRLPSYWIAPSFYISDYGLYGLATPPYGYNWSRYYDDAVLIDSRGKVRDYVGGVNWDGYEDGGYADRGYDQDYQQGAPYPAPGYGPGPRAGYPAPGGPGYRPLPPITANGGVTTYSTGGYYAGGYYYPGATTTTVVVQSAPSVTTTTTEYVERTRYVAKKVWRKPVRKWRPKPKVECVCGS